MTEKERMLSGKLYNPADGELLHARKNAQKLTRFYNASLESDTEYRQEILKKLLGSCGENIHIEPDFRCDYGSNIYIGKNFFANYGCVILDVCRVYIGDNVMFAPRTSLLTATHPIDSEIRAAGLEYGKPIEICDDVWLGAGVIINPGITIGKNSVIGSGSIVVKDIPENTIAAGNPCKIIREITEKEKQYWRQMAEEYVNEMKN